MDPSKVKIEPVHSAGPIEWIEETSLKREFRLLFYQLSILGLLLRSKLMGRATLFVQRFSRR